VKLKSLFIKLTASINI